MKLLGGATGSGAPKGNRNAQTHGFFAGDAKAGRWSLQTFVREAEEHLAGFEGDGQAE